MATTNIKDETLLCFHLPEDRDMHIPHPEKNQLVHVDYFGLMVWDGNYWAKVTLKWNWNA